MTSEARVTGPGRPLAAATFAVPILVFLIVYLANAGRGFLLDDFDWVLHSRVRQISDIRGALGAWSGFFRPVVGVTFTINEWLFGTHAYGYAITNMALALACAWAIGFLARGFALTRGAAALAGILWLMNLYVPRSSIMWISGRTALLVVIAGVLSAGWLVRGRLMPALGWLVVALLAKEEAVLLPIVLLGWLLVARSIAGRPPVPIGRWIAGSGAVLALYLVLRSGSSAMTPATAPDYYRFTFDLQAIWKNVTEYADRTSTLAVVAALLSAVVLGWRGRDDQSRIAIRSGLIWLAGTLALAVVLPVRSDLYAAVPAVGASLAAAALIDRFWAASTPSRQRTACAIAIAISVLLAPAYWLRTQRLARHASFSTRALDELEMRTRDLPPGTRVRVEEAPVESVGAESMGASFGAQVGSALELRLGRRIDIELLSHLTQEERDADAAKPGPVVTIHVVAGQFK